MAQSCPAVLKEPSDFIRLWDHECLRVFSDRLVNDEDREWFSNQIKFQMTTHFAKQHSGGSRGPREGRLDMYCSGLFIYIF